MFVGHYAVSFALKSAEKKAPLAALFIAVQFLDVIFFPLTLMGIEKFSLIENYTESTHFNLLHMPYSHSLVAAFLWSLGVFLLLSMAVGKRRKVAIRVAAAIAIAVISHWCLDLIVHTPDLPLSLTGSEKYGFGLWENALATYFLEMILLVGGLYLYMKSTHSSIVNSSKISKYGMPVFVVFLLAVNLVNIFGPLSETETNESTAISTLIAYFFLAAIAFWLDRKRTGLHSKMRPSAENSNKYYKSLFMRAKKAILRRS